MANVTVLNPYEKPNDNLPQRASAGIESNRVVAEIQAAVMLARKFKRNPKECVDSILSECQRPGLANDAIYTYARGGTDITGPSIRLAETIARNWQNIDFGIKELSQDEGKSEMMAYAWDLETNVRQTKVFIVEHIRYTRKGVKQLTDPRDIYEATANNGARRLRACILGVIPRDVIDAAVDQCEATMMNQADVSPDAVEKMVKAFKTFGVTKKQIEERIQRSVESMRPNQLVQLRKIYTSLKDNMSIPADWFSGSAGGHEQGNDEDFDPVHVVEFNAKAIEANALKIEVFLQPVADAKGWTMDQAKAAIIRENDFAKCLDGYKQWETANARTDSGPGNDDMAGPGAGGQDPAPEKKAPTVEESIRWCVDTNIMQKYFEDKKAMVKAAIVGLGLSSSVSGLGYPDLHQKVKDHQSAKNVQKQEDAVNDAVEQASDTNKPIDTDQNNGQELDVDNPEQVRLALGTYLGNAYPAIDVSEFWEWLCHKHAQGGAPAHIVANQIMASQSKAADQIKHFGLWIDSRM